MSEESREIPTTQVQESLSRSIEGLFERGRELNEKIVLDETSVHNLGVELDQGKEKLAVLEGLMWLYICEKRDATQKPMYANEQARKAAHAEFITQCRDGDPKTTPEEFKEYAPLVLRVRELEHECAMHHISASAMRRFFSLICATLNAKNAMGS